MRRQPWGLYAIALAILVVGLVALGVPASTLLFAALVLTCPLMMIFMMGRMHGGHSTGDQDHETVARPRTVTTTRPQSAGNDPAGGWRRSR